MGDKTNIEWTDATWNPVTGCTKVSQGCKNCYAERVFPRAYGKERVESGMTKGYFNRRITRPRKFTDVQCHPERLDQPLRWKKPRRIFVNSMSDLFHEAVPEDFIHQVWGIMRQAPQHTYQILTKRAERMMNTVKRFSRQEAMGYASGFYSHVWLGVSCEDQATADERIPILLKTPAAVRFVSYEPALGPIKLAPFLSRAPYREVRMCPRCLYFTNRDEDQCPNDGVSLGPDLAIDWIIVGGESGPHARPMHPDWARSVRDQCQATGVPFFFKQWGEWCPGYSHNQRRLAVSRDPKVGGEDWIYMVRSGKKTAGAQLDGREWREFPMSDNPKSKIENPK